MGTLRLRCSKCPEMKHWNTEDALPDNWAFRFKGNVTINSKRKYKDFNKIDPKNLFCSEECFNGK